MSELVERLSQGEHPVEISLRPERNVKALRDCIDRGYVHVKFAGTRGGTELGVRMDKTASDLTQADFENQKGTILVVGGLTLDYVKVTCTARVDLANFQGTGHLTPVAVESVAAKT